MGKFNIQHPTTKQWRCFSTTVDNWISDWMPEEQYREFLIQQAVNDIKYELEHIGLKQSYNYTYNDAVFTAARMNWKDTHCKGCKNGYCGDCPVYQYNAESYMTDCDDDFLGCKKEMIANA